MVVTAMREARWQEWKPEMVALVEHWFSPWWGAALTWPIPPLHQCGGRQLTPPAHRRAEHCLKLIAFSDMDVTPLLDRWRQDESMESAAQLADFVLGAGPQWNLGTGNLSWQKLWFSSSDDANPGRATELGVDKATERQVEDWLFSPESAKMLERAFFACKDDDLAKRISDAPLYLPESDD